MYAIKNKNTGKWVSGTDFHQSYDTRPGLGDREKAQIRVYKQRMLGSALTYNELWEAEVDFDHRGCSTKNYVIRQVKLVEITEWKSRFGLNHL